ncbi:putative glucose-6-phosphate 1-epimerase [Octopus sinensis]|uniref:glucose-6-phosphate 1-epimerase n=1 Tax=Octopus sinensis TaxID=2607531 RepID=A0A6P7S4J4_9MOLL|nr:putative glucose-6-phosphate 1-epimerase [Octopus sinensis]
MNYSTEDIILLDRGADTSVTVHLHGATIISWRCAGEEMLFLSKNAIFDNLKAIRGGIPLVFPKFGPWKYGPQHGFARVLRWKVEMQPKKDKNGNVFAALSLEDNDLSRAMWNIMFKLVYTIRLEESALHIDFTVHNTDKITFGFNCLLHTYLATPDITKSGIIGLQNLNYQDKVNNCEDVEEKEELIVREHIDRIYMDAPNEIVVGNMAGNRSLMLKTFNFPDIVIWNPWREKAKAMLDLCDSDYMKFVCVEAGRVNKDIVLKPGQSYECSQILAAITALL